MNFGRIRPREGRTALSAPINKLIKRLKNRIFSQFQFVDHASIAFALFNNAQVVIVSILNILKMSINL
ncbi:hypothetical protein [Leptospira kirschneri]|uniref:Uncharacterized protein n=2 Tax=Leptospira kirschneri TaxID=29507 RepID=A0A828YAB5_9LEPT|nr:hypothetical protein [Leptospira kirschneri]EKO52636.1 hypothetical protein LEP1GSC131_0885 [Leptospira kirschneri str. 200802841]EKO61644.1 hypothetical protein LEP1GSC082_4032 [Leptospira kirschneri str. H2]EKP03653.1 hypothetical protein LEP1GSC018_0389 [Leptospira kirschneri str. 2008720114]EKR07816.1 hypothetical protein LEP1GSC122_2391 [Leptospira kirschneri serovar Valbuzzi str. 200702274]EMK02775.1 hypothetical protein LEP1GSC176_0641 [Leptospira kirschneri str. MMD1493]EMK24833.1 